MRGLAAILLTAVLSGCAWLQGGAQTRLDGADAAPIQGQYEMGKTYLALGQNGLALAAFRQSLRENPDSVRALNAVAACYDRMLRFDLADRYYERALALDPQSAETLNNVGYSYYRRSQEGYGHEYLASAKLYLERARDIAADNSVVAQNIARVSTAADQVAKRTPESATVPPGFQFIARNPYASWIERLSQAEVLLVTRPDQETAALTRSLGVTPALAVLTARASTPPEPDARPSCRGPRCSADMPVVTEFLGNKRPLEIARNLWEGGRIVIARLD